MPLPNKKESQTEYIRRFMSDPEMKRKHPRHETKIGNCIFWMEKKMKYHIEQTEIKDKLTLSYLERANKRRKK